MAYAFYRFRVLRRLQNGVLAKFPLLSNKGAGDAGGVKPSLRIRMAPTTLAASGLRYPSRSTILDDSAETLFKRDASPLQRFILKGCAMTKAKVLFVSTFLA